MRISRFQALMMASTAVVFLKAQAPGPAVSLNSEDITRMRVFEEPLHAIGGRPSADENRDLLDSLQRYQAGGRTEDVRPLLEFLKKHPTSPWKPSLLTNLGLVYRRSGYYSRALDAWEVAWSLAKGLKDSHAQPVGDRAAAELAELLARLGRVPRLEAHLREVGTRPVRGSASEKLIKAKESLALMTQEPERSFRCGPVSLASIRVSTGNPEPRLYQENSTSQGTSLAHNLELAAKYGMNFQMAKRQPGASVVVPSVVHWKTGHFAAIVKEANGRYLLQDPIFPDDIWVTKAALDDEATGYALIPKGKLLEGWAPVNETEGKAVWGKGGAPMGDPNALKKQNRKIGSCPNPGMAGHSFHELLASLSISDIPVGHVPAKGPSALFEVTYLQREQRAPQTPTYSNLGPKWTHDFLSFIEDDPTIAIDYPTLSMRVWTLERGGGWLPFVFNQAKGADVAASTPTGPSLPQSEDFSQLIRLNLTSYVRVHPDGSKEFYEHSDGARTFPRRIFLSRIVDPMGATLNLEYDDQHRLTALVDAQVRRTTLSYELTGDPLKITKVTDPFERTATFEYNAAGQLAKITDVVGITSAFSYGPTTQSPDLPADFVNALTTPYGTHHYTTGQDSDGLWVEAEDPLGNHERMEFKRHPVVSAHQDPLPPGFTTMKPGGSLYWSKRAMAVAPGDYNQARYTRWMIGRDGEGSVDYPFALKPAGSPIFTQIFSYPGQTTSGYSGILNKPSRIYQPQPDGTWATTAFEYNTMGRPTKSTDPLGRETTFVYAENALDLLEVRQTSHGRNDLLATYTYDGQHRPLTVTDAAGQVTRLTYNAQGQIETVSNPLGQSTRLTYDAQQQLETITAPGNRVTRLTYDAQGRVATVTNPEGQTVGTNYDALDRPTLITYPDGTTEELRYDRLDVAQRKDRSGKWTTLTYNPLRQLIEVEDALGRITRFDWCGCGVLEGLRDPMNKLTSWLHDLQGRVIGKLFPDGGRASFSYDTLGRLSQRVDAKGQITRYGYNLDGALKEVTYLNTSRPEPSVKYEYELEYNRLALVQRNDQQIKYQYAPVVVPPALGAGRLATVTGPLPTDVITYGYDELGRVNLRSVKGRESTTGFDALGRVANIINPLGAFTYGYDGNTGRLSSVSSSTGPNTSFSYYGADQDFRLKDLNHGTQAGELVSKFAYTYDLDGQIKTWTQTPGQGDPRTFEFTYDPVGQLLGASLSGLNGQIFKRFAYGYDPSGNRTSETVDGRTTTGTYNDVNQLLQLRSSANDAPVAKGAPTVPKKKAAPKVVPKPTRTRSTTARR